MKKLFKITPEGKVEALWDDMLADLGTPEVQRASEVEYNSEAGGWTVQFLIGRFSGCFLPKAFPCRKDALNAEVDFLNVEMLAGELALA